MYIYCNVSEPGICDAVAVLAITAVPFLRSPEDFGLPLELNLAAPAAAAAAAAPAASGFELLESCLPALTGRNPPPGFRPVAAAVAAEDFLAGAALRGRDDLPPPSAEVEF